MSNQSKRIYGVPAQLVFFIVALFVFVFSALFFYLGFQNISQIQERVYASDVGLASPELAIATGAPQKDLVVRAYTTLESDVMRLRHNRVSSLLITRTWLRFMSSMFGSILITIGALFVLAQVKGDEVKAGVQAAWGAGTLSTSSPGLLLATLGAILMGWPLAASQDITSADRAAYGYFVFSDASNVADITALMLPMQRPENVVNAEEVSSLDQEPPPERVKSVTQSIIREFEQLTENSDMTNEVDTR